MRAEGQKGRCYIGGQLTACTPSKYPKGEVMRMWKGKVIQALRILLIAALVMYLLTTKAC